MNTKDPQLYLASASPRRGELLDQIGIGFQRISVQVDESVHSDEAPLRYAERLARDKANAGHTQHTDLPVLGADTCVVVDGQILGKPESADHAVTMLQRLCGRVHHVYSAVALCHQHCHSCISVSSVTFRSLSLDECWRYAKTGEPLDKAGGYAIQGRAASFTQHIEGSYSGIMGLPLYETSLLLRLARIPVI